MNKLREWKPFPFVLMVLLVVGSWVIWGLLKGPPDSGPFRCVPTEGARC